MASGSGFRISGDSEDFFLEYVHVSRVDNYDDSCCNVVGPREMVRHSFASGL